MHISQMNWMQVEAYLQRDDRCVLPLGSTEQHAYLSLSVDSILSERLAVEAAEPLGVPVFPVLAYGITPYFAAYPGTISLRIQTYLQLIRDILDGLRGQGFRRVLIVNGHGGNRPAAALVQEWTADHPEMRVRFHNWWIGPRTWEQVQAYDPDASHASWMENFPWTRLEGVSLPPERKPMFNGDRLMAMSPQEARERLGDGSFGGLYQRPDEELYAIWRTAVEETRALLEAEWKPA